VGRSCSASTWCICQPHCRRRHSGRRRRARLQCDQSDRSQAELRRLPYTGQQDRSVARRCRGAASHQRVGADLFGPAPPPSTICPSSMGGARRRMDCRAT
jgi:hypothetical protein